MVGNIGVLEYQEKQRRLLNQKTKLSTHCWKEKKSLIIITEKKIQIFIYNIKQVKIYEKSTKLWDIEIHEPQ